MSEPTLHKLEALPNDQPDANPDRGEHEVVLAGTTYRLRPSFAAITAIERKCEKSLMAITRSANDGAVSLDTVGIIARELIRAGAQDELTRNVSAERLAQLAFEEGLPVVVSRLTLCLADAVTGGRDTEGNVKTTSA